MFVLNCRLSALLDAPRRVYRKFPLQIPPPQSGAKEARKWSKRHVRTRGIRRCVVDIGAQPETETSDNALVFLTPGRSVCRALRPHTQTKTFLDSITRFHKSRNSEKETLESGKPLCVATETLQGSVCVDHTSRLLDIRSCGSDIALGTPRAAP